MAVHWPTRLLWLGSMYEGRLRTFQADAHAHRRSCRLQLALAEAAGSPCQAANARLNLADAALMAGDLDESAALGQAAVDELRQLQLPYLQAIAAVNLVGAHVRRGDSQGALIDSSPPDQEGPVVRGPRLRSMSTSVGCPTHCWRSWWHWPLGWVSAWWRWPGVRPAAATGSLRCIADAQAVSANAAVGRRCEFAARGSGHWGWREQCRPRCNAITFWAAAASCRRRRPV